MSHPLNLPLVVTSELPPNTNMDYVDYVNSTSPEAVASMGVRDKDISRYEKFVEIPENPLSVDETDRSKNRYMAYQQWLKTGKLKQQRIGMPSIRV